VIAIAALAAFVVWVLAIRDDGDKSSTATVEAGAGPVASSEEQLSALADSLGHPLYWAGPEDGAELEVRRTTDGQVYVRYLTGGAEVGDPRADFLTVGTYPFKDAAATLEEQATRPGALHNTTPDGGVVVTNEDSPTSVYVAYPGEDLQVEIYDKDAEQAFKLATSGDIAPVD
jgi:hypothetical protein